MRQTIDRATPGFFPDPTIRMLQTGEYLNIRTCYFLSRHTDKIIEIPGSFIFAPSVPRLFARIVYVDSRVVKASLPHDFLYQTQPEWCDQELADKIGREVLEIQGASLEARLSFYYGLRVGGGFSWRKNRRRLDAMS